MDCMYRKEEGDKWRLYLSLYQRDWLFNSRLTSTLTPKSIEYKSCFVFCARYTRHYLQWGSANPVVDGHHQGDTGRLLTWYTRHYLQWGSARPVVDGRTSLLHPHTHNTLLHHTTALTTYLEDKHDIHCDNHVTWGRVFRGHMVQLHWVANETDVVDRQVKLLPTQTRGLYSEQVR